MQERGRVRRRAVLLGALALLTGAGTACGAAQDVPSSSSGSSGSSGSATPDPSATPSPTNSPQVPTDGVTLAQLGFVHGPATFSIPRGATITTASDQENTVTLVFAAPDPLELASYFRRALGPAGFTVTGDRVAGDAPTLTFVGDGWRGSFTGQGSVSGVTLMRGTS